MKFLKGMGTGLLVGACIGMAVAPDPKSRKHQVSKAFKTVGQAIEDMGNSIRF